ncbi:phage tail sheath family protein [Photorhabdus laumondii subsp. laumondii]|uniref:Phage tail sheath family protein n=1 Tax=Photorhabdus laumondii subsp. laumondii TaxID=141679 RepID=A0A6L9JMN6_PHOLM|nr:MULTISPECIES: phage tail sheath subtilisin-like domain-containing protein [Photorhabdus]AXG43124.1 phage tail sheath family protein [Photorhabdus laumondii subsp. laumondii]MCC8384781.1 phage tail sheath family protein [Photorhabdus laumondii]MCC8389917.1 phage tail sheath family protein [Photorhabdus laumondii]MCC8414554.1 phage tail sheath family protein [Photorhabdus laumondii]MCZ1251276.1 phage tail sheath family protein [Photorhabdus laumondii subsp. laumondii]
MPIVPTYPGVYIEEDASPALSVSQGSTAIPVFIGRFLPKETSTTPKITRISSWLDFTNQFHVGCVTSITIKSTPPPAAKKSKKVEKVEGDISTENENGEVKNDPEEEKKSDYTYEVTVNHTTSSDALKLYFQNGGGPCYILPIADTNNTTLALIPELIKQALEITLIVCSEQGSGYQSQIYNSLTSSLLNEGYFLIADNQDKAFAISTNVSSQTATYYPAVKVSQLMQMEESLIDVLGYKDAKANNVTNLTELKEKNPNVYKEAITAIKNVNKTIPASAVMAGVYCATDASRGVWKAPANIVLSGISDVEERLTEDEQGTMNQKGINVIRYFNNRGFVVWGTRTLKDDDNWRYIPVRRLFNAAERDIKQAMRFAVFEPNSQPTWERVRSAIDNYLHQLWQQGALVGSHPQEAYFVQIGQGVTMSEVDIKQGRMIVKVGMAAVRPAEFIILQFSQKVAQ